MKEIYDLNLSQNQIDIIGDLIQFGYDEGFLDVSDVAESDLTELMDVFDRGEDE